MTLTQPAAPRWLSDGVLYQIYPQSFADSDGDGIGDFRGIRERLDYLQWLGVTAVWLNPCFVSPFTDAGYDVADYHEVAPRYGTEADLVALFEAAHERGIRVMLDLVAGHTSDQHPWFLSSADDPEGEYADRYIWTPERSEPPPGFVPSPGRREGCYLPNFFATQPALNFGYARQDPAQPWRQPPDAPGPRANREALRTVMSHWLDRGADGFRVDMAFSLVKDDPDGARTAEVWREMRRWLDRRYPEAAMVAEWGDPAVAINAGFHLDFFLHFRGRAFRSLVDTGAVQRTGWETGPCFFDPEGAGSAVEFLDEWDVVSAKAGEAGLACLPTSNHDFPRLVCAPRDREQVPPAMVLILTWPSVPAVYYGDEIGMRYVPGLPDKEGSALSATYNRAGSRTPMQWDDGDNAGFSTAPSDQLYLPVDPNPGRPTVATQRSDPSSLLHLVRRLIRLRREHPAFGPRGSVDVLAGRETPYPLVFVRGDGAQRFLVAVNPRREPAAAAVRPDGMHFDRVFEPVLHHGARLTDTGVELDGFGYGIWALPA